MGNSREKGQNLKIKTRSISHMHAGQNLKLNDVIAWNIKF